MEQTASQELTLGVAVERLVGAINNLEDKVVEPRPKTELKSVGGGSTESKVRYMAQTVMNQAQRIEELIQQLPI